ncbi:regulatory protein, luxR family [Friedmanniella luteola]|uniref:Regulatory protein, luxR family n=1 Tax=Friedmanniella luteola TaxID=546871 RepID=A0A1H1THP7_9ACTN|nr:LuxR family transcriptional regulator [Friedmanniella luteola]SDS59825.1 regulatory protein, luxR family [Friedmanniella luteola]
MGAVTGLVGRDEERRSVAALVAGARNGVGGALVLRGEPGIGKTALLAAATTGLVGVRVLRVDGFEAESSMPFAALQRLLTPLRPHLQDLLPRHQQALLTAAGLGEGPPPDRFLVGLAVLGLLAAAGSRQPVVCVVDDAQWLDHESLEVLAFVGRRLQAESAALLLAVREEDGVELPLAGVRELRLAGLDTASALTLLGSVLHRPLDRLAAAQVVRATGGNPLALVDLAEEWTPARLVESSLAAEPVPIGRHLEAHYLRRVHRLEPAVQLWVLVAAADSTDDVRLVEAAAATLDLPAGTGDVAETEGLVELGGTLRFRHPLVRSAVYNAARGADRRRVHRALSSAAERAGQPELEAWHAAKAALGTDAVLADRLEQVADRAGRRGGHASRLTVLRRAAELTPPGEVQARRLIGAAESALAAGAAQVAGGLLDEAEQQRLPEPLRGRLIAVRAALGLFTADGPSLTRASAAMLEAARCFRPTDPALEQDALIKAFEYSLPAERLLRDVTLERLGRCLEQGAQVGDGPPAVLLGALAAHVLRPFPDAVPVLRDAVRLLAGLDPEDLLRYGTVSVALTTALWDERARRACLHRTAEAARDAGSLQLLESVLWIMSLAELTGGTPRRAEEHMNQVRELRRVMGYDAEHVVNAALLAWSGAPRAQVQQVAEGARAAGFGGVHASAQAALAVVDLAGGHYRDARDGLAPLVAEPFLQTTPHQYPDFIEAAVRSGHRDEATDPLRRLETIAATSGSAWARGVAQRSRALVTDDASAGPLYGAAVATLQTADVPVELGRAHLLHGEWLRRLRRRGEARDQLQAAVALFEQSGAEQFARRARAELGVTGGRSTPDGAVAGVDLTAQEATVARLAASGRTNAEIGAALFISANTVDYHLRKVFQKFGITSRRQLADRLDA